MSDLNKDGLVPGSNVDFETINKINKQRKVEVDDAKQSKPRKEKEVHSSDESELQDIPKPASKKKTKKS